jgi:hypothetical protein
MQVEANSTGMPPDKKVNKAEYLTFLYINIDITCGSIKNSRFWPSADGKPMLNELVHAMSLQCMFALSLWVCNDLNYMF